MASVHESNVNVNKKVTLPQKSGNRYINTYDKFLNWRKSKNSDSFDEEILLKFFLDAAETFKPTSLLNLFSRLKATIYCKHNVNIAEYNRLIGFLREKQVGFKSKKTSHFSDDEIRRFLREAPDDDYLGIKSAAVLGIYGACRIEEIANFRVHMIKDYGTEIIVRIPDTKTQVIKVYSITGEFADTVRKYYRLRPAGIKTDRFFLQYRDGKCIGQVIGKNTILRMPRKIAEFLKLDDPAGYTGRSFRGTSTKLTDTVVSNEKINRNGAGESNTVDKVEEDEQDFTAANYIFNDTYDELQFSTDEDTVCILDSSSEDDEDVIITSTDHQSEIEFVDFAPQSNANSVEAEDIGSKPDTAYHNVTLCQSQMEDQVKEIYRLTQLTEKQCVEIEILKDLLQKSMKRNVPDEISSERLNNSNIGDLKYYMSSIPAKAVILDD